MARPTLFGHRKLVKLGTMLGDEARALGHLEFIWHAANETGNPVIGDAHDVEAIAKWKGEPGALVKALLGCGSAGGAGFLDALEDGRFEIHDYWHHAPKHAGDRRARENERRRAKVCEQCRGDYFSSDPRSKYCSAACKTAAWRTRHDGEGPARDGCDGPLADPSQMPQDPSQSSEDPSRNGPRKASPKPLRDGACDGLPSQTAPPQAAPLNDCDGSRDGSCDGVTDRYYTPDTRHTTHDTPKIELRRADSPPTIDAALFAEARRVFGDSIGGTINKAIGARGKPWVLDMIEQCRGKDPEAARAYLHASLKPKARGFVA
jgi:hypothetical protein